MTEKDAGSSGETEGMKRFYNPATLVFESAAVLFFIWLAAVAVTTGARVSLCILLALNALHLGLTLDRRMQHKRPPSEGGDVT